MQHEPRRRPSSSTLADALKSAEEAAADTDARRTSDAAAVYFRGGGTVEYALDALLSTAFATTAATTAALTPAEAARQPRRHPLDHFDALSSVLLGPDFVGGPHPDLGSDAAEITQWQRAAHPISLRTDYAAIGRSFPSQLSSPPEGMHLRSKTPPPLPPQPEPESLETPPPLPPKQPLAAGLAPARNLAASSPPAKQPPPPPPRPSQKSLGTVAEETQQERMYWWLSMDDEERWKRTHLIQKTHNEYVQDVPHDEIYGWHPRLRPTDVSTGAWLAGLLCIQRATGAAPQPLFEAPPQLTQARSVLQQKGLPSRVMSPPVE